MRRLFVFNGVYVRLWVYDLAQRQTFITKEFHTDTRETHIWGPPWLWQNHLYR